jgi:hypothetical protein
MTKRLYIISSLLIAVILTSNLTIFFVTKAKYATENEAIETPDDSVTNTCIPTELRDCPTNDEVAKARFDAIQDRIGDLSGKLKVGMSESDVLAVFVTDAGNYLYSIRNAPPEGDGADDGSPYEMIFEEFLNPPYTHTWISYDSSDDPSITSGDIGLRIIVKMTNEKTIQEVVYVYLLHGEATFYTVPTSE